jgi:hypothetical protein
VKSGNILNINKKEKGIEKQVYMVGFKLLASSCHAPCIMLKSHNHIDHHKNHDVYYNYQNNDHSAHNYHICNHYHNRHG